MTGAAGVHQREQGPGMSAVVRERVAEESQQTASAALTAKAVGAAANEQLHLEAATKTTLWGLLLTAAR